MKRIPRQEIGRVGGNVGFSRVNRAVWDVDNRQNPRRGRRLIGVGVMKRQVGMERTATGPRS